MVSPHQHPPMTHDPPVHISTRNTMKQWLTASCSQGAQGTYDAAAKGTLESEFGTSVDDEVIKIILEKGALQTSEVSAMPT